MKSCNQKKRLLSATFLLACLITTAQIKINPAFYGSNYWGTNAKDAPFGSIQTFTGSQWQSIRESGVVMMRQGGANYNRLEDPLMSQYSAPNFGSSTDWELTLLAT